MLRFIHCADMHIDSPFKGVAALDNDLATRLQAAPFLALERMVDLALSENVDFVLIAGDIWDSQEKSLTAQLRFNAQMRRLAEYNIPCFYVCGNHDPLPSGKETVQLPENVHRFGGEVTMIPLKKNGQVIAHIYGISFTKAAETDNLSLRFSRQDMLTPSLAILHCNVGDTGHENYAPARLEDLALAGMDYWALGHVHQYKTLRPHGPTVVYPGCAQGCNPRETGAHGCCLVEMTDGAAEVKFIPLDTIRFAATSCNITDFTDWEAVITELTDMARQTSLLQDGRAMVLRVTLTGKTILDAECHLTNRLAEVLSEVNARLVDAEPFIRVERLIPATSGVFSIDELASGSDFTAELINLYRHENNNAMRNELDKVLTQFCGASLTDAEFQQIMDNALDQTLNLIAGGR